MEINKTSEQNSQLAESSSSNPSSQVKPTRTYKPRKQYPKVYRLKILAAYDACETSQQRGELLRREGLYSSRICAWRTQQAKGNLSNSTSKLLTRTDALSRENEQLKKKLAQAEAIIELQKKVSDLFGMSILSSENRGDS